MRKLKPIRTAIQIGILAAGISWPVVYIAIHEPRMRIFDGGLSCQIVSYVIGCPEDDDGLAATLSAAGVYALTFTSGLLLLQARIRNPFAR